MNADEKAAQIERAFGVLHPVKALRASLRRRDDPNREPYNPVTPYHRYVARQRLREIEARGFEPEDALIVLLMRGSRIEALAHAEGVDVEEVAAQVRHRLAQIDVYDDDRITEAQRCLDLSRRA